MAWSVVQNGRERSLAGFCSDSSGVPPITDVNLFYWDYRDPSQIFTYSYNIFPPSHQFSVKVEVELSLSTKYNSYIICLFELINLIASLPQY